MGLSFPILYDEGGGVHAEYNPGGNQTNSAYPQDWIIGADGTVVYVNNTYDPDLMRQIIEEELDMR